MHAAGLGVLDPELMHAVEHAALVSQHLLHPIEEFFSWCGLGWHVAGSRAGLPAPEQCREALFSDLQLASNVGC